MKTMLNKTLLTIVANLLVLPFAAFALLAGEQARTVFASAQINPLFIALGVGSMLIGMSKGFRLAHSSTNENAQVHIGAAVAPAATAKIGGGAWRGLSKHPGY
ncbi:MAG: hypothetical protein ACR2G4_11190 [Pyrinomonadaceae bacterium]